MRIIFIVFLASLLSCCHEVDSKVKPNIIVILVDDMGWGDIGYNNPESVYSPNLDRLASEGVVFANHYVMPQCTPTRVAALTGRYPGRFGKSALHATNDKVFPVGTPTLATMLRQEGYRTYLSGKWHMGSDTVNGPNHHGFDESYGSMAGAVGMYNHKYRQGKYEETWHRNHRLLPSSENGTHATDLISAEAQRIIRMKEDSPFFLFLTFHAPHTPLDERGPFVDRPTQKDSLNSTRWLNEDKIKWFNDPDGKIQSEKDPEKRLLLAAVNHLDDAIGKIMKTLDEEDKTEETIILFSSDNGPQVNWVGNIYPDDLELSNFNQDIPMRGAKLDVYEGGIHVPAFIYWKGKLEPNVIKETVHIIDWFPTLAGMSHHRKTEKYSLDGVDLNPLLFEGGSLEDRSLYWVWHPTTRRWALRYGDWKIVKYGPGIPQVNDWQLYNLKNDPKESTDIAKENQGMVERLHEMFLMQKGKDRRSSN